VTRKNWYEIKNIRCFSEISELSIYLIKPNALGHVLQIAAQMTVVFCVKFF